MEASGTSAIFSVSALPLLSQARRLASEGVAPGGSRSNVRAMRARASFGEGVSEDDVLLACDAQTSGGLLVALPQEEAEAYAARCRERGAPAGAVVGRVVERGEASVRLER
jgi:selenide, water dikinase